MHFNHVIKSLLQLGFCLASAIHAHQSCWLAWLVTPRFRFIFQFIVILWVY